MWKYLCYVLLGLCGEFVNLWCGNEKGDVKVGYDGDCWFIFNGCGGNEWLYWWSVFVFSDYLVWNIW